jgi:hypothetical protein
VCKPQILQTVVSTDHVPLTTKTAPPTYTVFEGAAGEVHPDWLTQFSTPAGAAALRKTRDLCLCGSADRADPQPLDVLQGFREEDESTQAHLLRLLLAAHKGKERSAANAHRLPPAPGAAVVNTSLASGFGLSALL